MNKNKTSDKVKRLRVYSIIVFAFMLVLVLMPRQSAGMPEIENKLLITTMGIDKTANGYCVSAVVVMPQETHGGSVSKIEADAEGSSISEALEQISIKMGKPLELGLCGLVIVGDTFGEESIKPHLSYLLASGKIIPGAFLVAATDGMEAKKAIELANKLSDATSNVLSKLIEYNAVGSNLPVVSMLRFLSETNRKGESSFMPCLEIGEGDAEQGSEKGGSGEDGGGESSGGSSSGTGSGNKSEIKSLGKIAVYKAGVRTAIADEEITRGYTWSDRKSTLGLITLDDLTVGDVGCGEIHCQMLAKKYSIETSLDGAPHATVKVKTKLALEERSKLGELVREGKVTEREIETALRSGFEEKIKSEIFAAVEFMRNGGNDAFGFEDDIYRKHYRDYAAYEQKENILSDIKVDFEVKIAIE